MTGRRRAMPAWATLALAAAMLAGCSTAFGPGPNQAALQTPVKPEMPAAHQREHQRILAAYGGVYDDAAARAAD